jgi:methyltransferase
MTMFGDNFGPPQFAAALLLMQRCFDDLLSWRNTRSLVQQGGQEAAPEYYPVVAIAYFAWIAAIAFLIPENAPICLPALILYVTLQPIRYWAIWTLGRFWTHRIITLPGAPTMTKGPYRFLRHPVYVLTVVEMLLMPLAFGQPVLALIFTAVWFVVVRYKTVLEDAALADRRIEKS